MSMLSMDPNLIKVSQLDRKITVRNVNEIKDKHQETISNLNTSNCLKTYPDPINLKHKDNKIKIKNSTIKNLIYEVSDYGYYAPYFSMCKNCNERNNEFYNKMNEFNAYNIINLIKHEKSI